MGKKYSNSDCEFLKINYLVYGPSFCADKLDRNYSSIVQKAHKLKLSKCNRWTNEEIEFLKNNYSFYGTKYCKSVINKTNKSISTKANYLGLKHDSRKQKIIQILDNNKFLCKCKKHGIVVHHDYKNNLLACSLCARENARSFSQTKRGKEYRKNYRRNYEKEKRKDPKHNFVCRIRRRLAHCFNGSHISFRDLGYTSEQLKDHLFKIKDQQNNMCPGCLKNYDETGFTIEHIIPVSSGNSREDIINLFNLCNLSLMCRSCNSSKHKHNYQEWCKSKGISVDLTTKD